VTAGLGCDGDTIAMTGATQPSIEDILLGALPWIPKVRLFNPFLAYENGDDFVRPFREAAGGTSTRPFILVVEGSIPNENKTIRARVIGRRLAPTSDGAAHHDL
jgi:hydrogenase small subunit